MENQEFAFKGTVISGFTMLFINFAILLLSIFGIVMGIIQENGWWIGGSILLLIINIIMWCGHLQLEPNEARVTTWFGKYSGLILFMVARKYRYAPATSMPNPSR